MKYITAFRNPAAAAAIIRRISAAAAELQRSRSAPVRIMEVCGTHTMAIGRHGIRNVLPPNVELISGPGCPVCVTDGGYIDAAMEAAERGLTIMTFGDMLKVPGSNGSLSDSRSQGADIRVCYSPSEALEAARKEPQHSIVFLAIGFETTVAPLVSVLDQAISAGIKNISFLTAFKRVIPAMQALSQDPDVLIDAFLCPAHVSAIIGADAYVPIASRFKTPCVIAGFEPLDILLALQGILEQMMAGEARVDNQYSRVVRAAGNCKALALIDRYLVPADAAWRGIGRIPESGLAIRTAYAEHDAAVRHSIEIPPAAKPSACKCGHILKGVLQPPQCPLFGKVCVPEHPVGPCMVSSEGSCSAFFKYGGARFDE